MSEITLTVIKVLFLALLWLFIMSAASVIRSDLFGKAVPSADGDERRALAEPKPPSTRRRRSKGEPRRIAITGGRQQGEGADLAEGSVLIGRGADCAIILDDDYVSTRHARISPHEGGWFIEDLGSTNGTYVNGQRITAPTTVTLADSMRIGKTVLRLET